MEKNLIGEWGSDLSDADYSQTLAALGVLESTGTHQHRTSCDLQELVSALRDEIRDGQQTPIWRGAFNITGTTLESWHSTIYTNAQALADAWKLLISSTSHNRCLPRLAIDTRWLSRPDLFDFDGLIQWLSHQETSCQSLVLVPDYKSQTKLRTTWHWPIRVGIPSDPKCDDMYLCLRRIQNGWIEKLAELQRVGETRDACDILILPSGMAEQLTEQPRLRLQASFIISLDTPPKWSEACETPGARLLSRMSASGVAIAGNLSRLYYWYVQLIFGLSHDLPVHAALCGIDRNPPVILGDPNSLDSLRILAIAKRLDRNLSYLQPPGDLCFFDKKPSLATSVLERPFTSEIHDGLQVAEEIVSMTADFEKICQPRWLQAEGWRYDSEGEAAKAFSHERPNILSVHIGPQEFGRLEEAFPDSDITFNSGDVDITVQIILPGAKVMPFTREMRDFLLSGRMEGLPLRMMSERLLPLMDEPENQNPEKEQSPIINDCASTNVTLPPIGDSTPALFSVWPQEGVGLLNGKISVIHKNRVIQIARISIPVNPASNEGHGISVTVEKIIYGRDDALDDRPNDYDIMFQINDFDGDIRPNVSVDDRNYSINWKGLKEPIKNIQTTIERAALKWDYGKTLIEQPVLKDTLMALAANGSLLYSYVIEKCPKGTFDNRDRIQVVSGCNEYFPLEYCYDGPPPDLEAEVCMHAEQALREGDCRNVMLAMNKQAVTSCPNLDSDLFICPLRFWGFRKVIEHHGNHQGGGEPSEQNIPLTKKLVPNLPFGSIHSVLCGISKRALAFCSDPGGMQHELKQLLEAFSGLGIQQYYVDTWVDWKKKITNNPNVLVLIVHTEIYNTISVLEIGDRNLLGKHNIDSKIIGNSEAPQLLLLLGCSTADATIDFAPYPERFRMAGADIVIATLAPIRGFDALPIAKRIAQLLIELFDGGKEASFGELLPKLRRQLLAEGYPGVLGLVGFGDGDWILGGRNVHD